MVDLFEPYSIGNLAIRNRFMRSATTSYYADEEGIVRDSAIQLYENLAKGGVGLIVKGHLCVIEDGLIHQGMARISSDKHIPRLRELTDTVHHNDGTIVAQINHGGVRNLPDRVAPSEYIRERWTARALDEQEIGTIIEAFGDAAERVMQAGFDGVQIHGAHGYLISQFLSGEINRRSDKWGGTIENRMRFLTTIYDEVRKRIGNAPVMLKMNCDDFSLDGITVEESTIVAKTMADRGIDLIEISGGGVEQNRDLYPRAKHEDSELSELRFAGHAAEIRKVTGSTTFALVNGFATLNVMQAVIDRGITDLVSLSRPFIREPDLVRLLQAGKLEADCIRCDACLGADVFGKTMLRCQQD